jgi:hypothetical protein
MPAHAGSGARDTVAVTAGWSTEQADQRRDDQRRHGYREQQGLER